MDITLPTVGGAEIAAGATIVGGLILRYVEKWLTKSIDADTSNLREELRKDLESVRQEVKLNHDEITKNREHITALQQELDEWRAKYYTQVETSTELLFEVASLKNRLAKYEEGSGPHSIFPKLDDEE